MALVLVPGFMLDQDLWRDTETALARFGPVFHADPRSALSIEDMAARTLEAAPDRFALIGFSMGGYVAREIQRQAPERVTHLVLIATSARADGPAQASRKAVLAAAQPSPFQGLSRSAIRKALANPDDMMIERIHAMSVRLGGDTFQRQALFRRDGDIDRLGGITCPTLVIAGLRDRLRSLDETQELADGIQEAKLAVIDAGHMIPMEAPNEMIRLIVDFFAQS